MCWSDLIKTSDPNRFSYEKSQTFLFSSFFLLALTLNELYAGNFFQFQYRKCQLFIIETGMWVNRDKIWTAMNRSLMTSLAGPVVYYHKLKQAVSRWRESGRFLLPIAFTRLVTGRFWVKPFHQCLGSYSHTFLIELCNIVAQCCNTDWQFSRRRF